MLKLENDSIITLNNEEDAVAEYYVLKIPKRKTLKRLGNYGIKNMMN